MDLDQDLVLHYLEKVNEAQTVYEELKKSICEPEDELEVSVIGMSQHICLRIRLGHQSSSVSECFIYAL